MVEFEIWGEAFPEEGFVEFIRVGAKETTAKSSKRGLEQATDRAASP